METFVRNSRRVDEAAKRSWQFFVVRLLHPQTMPISRFLAFAAEAFGDFAPLYRVPLRQPASRKPFVTGRSHDVRRASQ